MSKAEVSALIKTEVASLLAAYEQQLAAAKSKADRQEEVIAGKEAEIASLKKELIAAAPAAEPPPQDPKWPLERHELRQPHLVEEHTKRVASLYAVRLVLGRLTEFVILYDRVLWLHENIAALNVFLVPVFDPVLSPRNVALVATKIGGSPPHHCTEAASPPRLGSAALQG